MGPKTWNTLFEVLQNDRSLSLNKGENSEYFGKALIGPQMEHFYHKSGQNPLIRLALGIQLRNVFGILHDDRRRYVNKGDKCEYAQKDPVDKK